MERRVISGHFLVRRWRRWRRFGIGLAASLIELADGLGIALDERRGVRRSRAGEKRVHALVDGIVDLPDAPRLRLRRLRGVYDNVVHRSFEDFVYLIGR